MDKDSGQISRGDASLVAVICFLLGGILSWILFSSPDGIRFPKKAGDAAEWLSAIAGAVAAAGTWAIGLGANRYAKEAHAQRVVSEAAQLAERRESRLRKIDAMITKATLASKQARIFLELPPDSDIDFKGLSPRLKRGKCKLLETAFQRIAWSVDDVASLRATDQRAIANAEISMMHAMHFIDLCKEEQFKGGVFFEAIVPALETLEVEAEDIKSRLIAERERVQSGNF